MGAKQSGRAPGLRDLGGAAKEGFVVMRGLDADKPIPGLGARGKSFNQWWNTQKKVDYMCQNAVTEHFAQAATSNRYIMFSYHRKIPDATGGGGGGGGEGAMPGELIIGAVAFLNIGGGESGYEEEGREEGQTHGGRNTLYLTLICAPLIDKTLLYSAIDPQLRGGGLIKAIQRFAAAPQDARDVEHAEKFFPKGGFTRIKRQNEYARISLSALPDVITLYDYFGWKFRPNNGTSPTPPAVSAAVDNLKKAKKEAMAELNASTRGEYGESWEIHMEELLRRGILSYDNLVEEDTNERVGGMRTDGQDGLRQALNKLTLELERAAIIQKGGTARKPMVRTDFAAMHTEGTTGADLGGGGGVQSALEDTGVRTDVSDDGYIMWLTREALDEQVAKQEARARKEAQAAAAVKGGRKRRKTRRRKKKKRKKKRKTRRKTRRKPRRKTRGGGRF